MISYFKKIKKIGSSLGLVEQSQMVASTAVVVLMMTMIAIYLFTGERLRWLDFLTLLTVGVFGFIIVYFIAKYGQQINEQHQQLLGLNTISQAVSRSVELDIVLQNALIKVCELLNADSGWIFMLENGNLQLKHKYKIQKNIFSDNMILDERWIEVLKLDHELSPAFFEKQQYVTAQLRQYNIMDWASLPLERNKQFVGAILIASMSPNRFKKKQLELLSTFRNQIELALNNAYLFEQLRQSEKLYHDLYENLPDMYHSINKDGLIVSCNQTELEYLGYDRYELIGKPITILYPAEKHNEVLERVKYIFDQKLELKGVEEIFQKKDGNKIIVSINTSLVYNSEGRPTLIRVVARDVTKQKMLEEKIIQAQKIDSIGNLAGGVAHDFNNILNSILGPASMMKRKINEQDKFYKYITLIEDSARRGAAVTRQLLTFSRKSNVYFKLTNINKIIEDTVTLFERSVPKLIQVKKNLQNNILLVNADEGQIEQAVLNLFLNAQDAMPDGGIITVTTRAVDLSETIPAVYSDIPPDKYVQIKIVDNGKGIPKESLNKIFEPFFSTKEQTKGTGLGLSVVYGVVKSHKGYITVESELNIGTAFSIYLPRVDKVVQNVESNETQTIVGGREHILIVDDDVGANIVAGDILKELGYKVTIAQDGFQAIEKFKNTNYFDLVILDLNMPGVSGKEVFYQMKKLNPAVKVIICSGYSDTVLNDDEFLKEIDGYLHKPYMYEDLAKSVREVLDN